MRACRRFRDITQPLLYESFPGQPVATLPKLNRTLFARPDLACMVKNITIDDWELDVFQGDQWWETTISDVGMSSQLIEAIKSKAEAGSEDAQVALLLCLCTEVQAIDISIPIMFRRASIVGMLMTEIGQQRPNTLFRGTDQDIPPHMPASLPLRKLRDTIKRLTLFRISFQPEKLPFLPSLEEVCLWRCNIGDYLGAMLAGCVNLRSLKVVWAGSSVDHMHNVYPMDTVIDYQQIGDFINEHLTKLETLVLDPREAYLFGKSCKQLHSLNLSSMEHLKELTVEAQALWDQHVTDECPPWEIKAPLSRLKDILPYSLTKLAILADRRSDHIARYLIDAPTSFQSFHLDVPYLEVEPGLRELKKLFADLGRSADEIIGDPDVQRSSPVVGATTPKEQRIKLRGIFGLWLPESGQWPTIVIEKGGEMSKDADWEEWRKVIDQKIEVARGWFRYER
ncbi:hypothetical protein CKM354_000777600 [Cercospora kikuchii]|uniref:F-box domain-containing protein n=1 Tax=Cercospora kikuchii TaxID=84275 RepID=A0A9P3FHS4_9PEZI|nr:uncharacterized protein CKM354_000777600 [Cercospora kikuchii]GIZ44582.1 hypothetical protein CKM354_000777600 [Cercospora kikuchii]